MILLLDSEREDELTVCSAFLQIKIVLIIFWVIQRWKLKCCTSTSCYGLNVVFHLCRVFLKLCELAYIYFGM